MPHRRLNFEVPPRGGGLRLLKWKAALLLIACIPGLAILLASAQENRLHKNLETEKDAYSNLARPPHPRTAAKEWSFRYFPPSKDRKELSPDFQNVQLLFLDTAKFMSNMAFMAQSLGVQCKYCHDLRDFSSDAVPAKQRAREMIEMVQGLNANQEEGGINCYTCHQGKTLAVSVPVATTDAAGEARQDAASDALPGQPPPRRRPSASEGPGDREPNRLPDLSGSGDRQREQEPDAAGRDPALPQLGGAGVKEAAEQLQAHYSERLLSRGVQGVEAAGRRKFGGNFRLDSGLRLGRRGLYGDVDALIPFGTVATDSTWFLQPGLALWEDRHGRRREEIALGLGRRFHWGEPAIVGLGGFLDYNFDHGHRRLGLSADYQSGAGYLSMNLYKRLSGWSRGRDEGVFQYEEIALDGAEFYFDYALTERFSMHGRSSAWKGKGRQTDTRTGYEAGVAYRLWPGLELTGGYSRHDRQIHDERWSLGLRFRFPFAERALGNRLPDLFRPIEREKRIFAGERIIRPTLTAARLGPGAPEIISRGAAFAIEIPALPRQPTADVIVTPRHSGAASVEYGTQSSGPFRATLALRFTPENWNRAQTVWARIPAPATGRSSGLASSAGAQVRQLQDLPASSVTIAWLYRSADPRYDGLTTSLTFAVRDSGESALAFPQAVYTVAEGAGTLTVSVILSAAAGSDVRLAVSTADGTAAAPGDYAAIGARTLTIPAGSTQVEFSISITDDGTVEAEETFTVSISADNLPAGVSLGAQSTATVRITDDDARPTAAAGADQTVNEGATVTLDGRGSSNAAGVAATGIGYAWTRTDSNTPAVSLANPSTARPTFTAPDVAAAVTYTFSLVVTQTATGVASAADTVNVTVNDVPALDGQALYTSNGCGNCHGTGVLGAPILGNAADWTARIARGTSSLYNSAINGRGVMPARGGSSASDAELRAIVDYMVGEASP